MLIQCEFQIIPAANEIQSLYTISFHLGFLGINKGNQRDVLRHKQEDLL